MLSMFESKLSALYKKIEIRKTKWIVVRQRQILIHVSGKSKNHKNPFIIVICVLEL